MSTWVLVEPVGSSSDQSPAKVKRACCRPLLHRFWAIDSLPLFPLLHSMFASYRSPPGSDPPTTDPALASTPIPAKLNQDINQYPMARNSAGLTPVHLPILLLNCPFSSAPGVDVLRTGTPAINPRFPHTGSSLKSPLLCPDSR